VVNGARVVVPSVAGVLMAKVGIPMCFLLNGISFLAVIAGLLMMRLPAFVPPERTGSAWEHAAEGFAYVWQNGRLRTMLILFALVGIFGWSYSVLMPAFARDYLGVGQAQYGLLLSVNGVGALLGALTVASIGTRVSHQLLVHGGLLVFSAMLLLLALVKNYYFALGCLAVGGWGMLLFFSTINTLLQTASSDQMRGRVMGVWALIFGGMTPIGGLEAGITSHYFGIRVAMAIGAVICAAAAFAVWLPGHARRSNDASESPMNES
jgi:predicted MFS family arabinose efflux permease